MRSFRLFLFTSVFCLLAPFVWAEETLTSSVRQEGTLQEQNPDSLAGEPFVFRIQPGFKTGSSAGYRLGNFRLEGEFTEQNSGTDKKEKNPNSNSNRETGTYSLLANVYYDFKNRSGFTPYIGAGAGSTTLTLGDFKPSYSSAFTGEEKTGFVYKGIAGLSYRVSPLFDISFEYNYFALENLDFKDESGNPFDTSYGSHNINLGFRLKF